MIYFDNAATSSVKPSGVIAAVNNALKNYCANPGRSGHSASLKTAEAVFLQREKIADFFHSKGGQNVVFTLNCTHSINCVIKGILNMGDHVVCSSLEHNSVMRPLEKISNNYTVAEVFDDDEATVESFKKAIKPNTKLVICTSASNVTGKTLPLEKIGEICKEKNIYFAVDAAQGGGILPIDIQKMNIDFLCVAPHKGLYAPMGIGVLICEKKLQETLIEGGTGTNSLELIQPEDSPERYESGTINVPGIMGVGAGVDFVNNVGAEKLYKYEMRLIQKLYKGLQNNEKIELYTEYPTLQKYVPVLSFNYKGLDSFETAKILSKIGIATRGGFHCAPSAHKCLSTLDRGLVRVSLSAFNKEYEIEHFLRIMSNKKLFENVQKSVE